MTSIPKVSLICPTKPKYTISLRLVIRIANLWRYVNTSSSHSSHFPCQIVCFFLRKWKLNLSTNFPLCSWVNLFVFYLPVIFFFCLRSQSSHDMSKIRQERVKNKTLNFHKVIATSCEYGIFYEYVIAMLFCACSFFLRTTLTIALLDASIFHSRFTLCLLMVLNPTDSYCRKIICSKIFYVRRLCRTKCNHKILP